MCLCMYSSIENERSFVSPFFLQAEKKRKMSDLNRVVMEKLYVIDFLCYLLGKQIALG